MQPLTIHLRQEIDCLNQVIRLANSTLHSLRLAASGERVPAKDCTQHLHGSNLTLTRCFHCCQDLSHPIRRLKKVCKQFVRARHPPNGSSAPGVRQASLHGLENYCNGISNSCPGWKEDGQRLFGWQGFSTLRSVTGARMRDSKMWCGILTPWHTLHWQGFLTAIKQEVARKHVTDNWALEDVVLTSEVVHPAKVAFPLPVANATTFMLCMHHFSRKH
jgi:hypothetical protein